MSAQGDLVSQFVSSQQDQLSALRDTVAHEQQKLVTVCVYVCVCGVCVSVSVSVCVYPYTYVCLHEQQHSLHV